MALGSILRWGVVSELRVTGGLTVRILPTVTMHAVTPPVTVHALHPGGEGNVG